MHRDDPGVTGQAAGGARLPEEAATLLVVVEGSEVDLDRHLPTQGVLARLPDHGEATPGEGAPVGEARDVRVSCHHRRHGTRGTTIWQQMTQSADACRPGAGRPDEPPAVTV